MGAGLETTFRRAKALGAQGQTAEAASLYAGILDRFPGNKRARKALALLPARAPARTDPEALLDRASKLRKGGSPDAALEAYAELLSKVPDHPDGLNNLAILLTDTGEYDAAISACRRAIAARPGFAQAYNNLGVVLRRSGDLPGSIQAFGSALEYDRDSPVILNNLGTSLKAAGRRDVALDCLRRALALRPGFAECAKNIAMLIDGEEVRSFGRHIRAIHTESRPGSEERMLAAYGLAELARKEGHVEATLAWLAEAGAIGKRLSGYDPNWITVLFDALKTQFETPPTPVATPTPAVTPIFITGMPRSGTTLMEQILANHSELSGAGELHLLTQLIEAEGGPEASAAPEALARIREGYLSGIQRFAGQARFVTDKQPLNFRWIGHIRAALPEARILHMSRCPEAVCWSNYRLHFPAPGMAFTFEQEDIAHYHRLHDDLMAFWTAQDASDIRTQDYARLTEAPEDEARALMTWLGLDWDPAVLEFHRSGRVIDTASAMQVRQEIYTGSDAAWRPFASGLAPLLDTLKNGPPPP